MILEEIDTSNGKYDYKMHCQKALQERFVRLELQPKQFPDGQVFTDDDRISHGMGFDNAASPVC